MVRSQTGLLIWLISNYKGQVKLSLRTHRHGEEERERERGVMQAFAKGDKRMLARLPARSLLDHWSAAAPEQDRKASAPSFFPAVLLHSRHEAARRPPTPSLVCSQRGRGGCRQVDLHIYLVVDTLPVESYVNGEGGGVVVRNEQRLLVRLVPHHKVQRGRALMGRRHVGHQEVGREQRKRRCLQRPSSTLQRTEVHRPWRKKITNVLRWRLTRQKDTLSCGTRKKKV